MVRDGRRLRRGSIRGWGAAVALLAWGVCAWGQTLPATRPSDAATKPASVVPAWAREEATKVVDEMLAAGRWVLPVPVTQADGTAPPANDREGLIREVLALLALVSPTADAGPGPGEASGRERLQLARDFLKDYTVNWHPVAVYLEYRDGQRPLSGRRLELFVMLLDAHVDRVMAGLRVKKG